MPQDGLRSVVYRSFVTCDDPKGVVQCGTIRKSRTGSHKTEHKAESQKTPNEYHSSLAPSLQLLEVSRGAEKLNQMINSWSDGKSGDVAKDLLKGALDLQESLAMLGKLQEASKCMARLKRQKERSRSDCFTGQSQNQNNDDGFQKRRLSVDGPSRDCIDQLREVIRDSFARQNLLQPNTRTENKAFFHQRSFGSDLEAPSTSSSQSSPNHSNYNRFGSTVLSLSPAAPYEKPKGPSLIARLMGLEEIPSKPVPNMTMKPQETVQLKRVLTGDSQREIKPQFHHFDDIAPIVLIKPMRAGSQDPESLEPTCWDEEALKTELFLRQLKMKRERLPNVGNFRENILSNKAVSVGGTKETVLKKLVRETGKDLRREVKKGDEFVVNAKGRASNKLKAVERINQKQQKDEVIEKRVDKVQKVASTSRKPVEKETVKSPSSRSQDQARVTNTRLKISEHGSNMKKIVNPNLISKSAKQPILHSPSRRPKNQTDKGKAKKKPASAQTTILNVACLGDSPTIEHDLAEKETVATFTDHYTTREVETDVSELHPAEKETTATFTDKIIITEEETDASEFRSADKHNVATFIDHLNTEEETRASELHSDGFRTIGTFTDHLIAEEETYASERQIEGVRMLNPEPKRDTKSAVEVLDNESHENVTDHISLRTHAKLKAFLLGSPSFMRHVEDLFDLTVSFPLPLQALNASDSAELSLHCANELVKRRSLPDSRKTDPLLLTCTGNTRIRISLDQLMEEVCDGVETLRSYACLAGEDFGVNNVYAMLERDVRSGGVVNGTWDFGWRNGFTVDEAELVVIDIDKLLLSELIEDAFA